MAGERPNFVNQIREIWSRLKWTQQLTIAGFGLGGIVFIGVLVYFMNRIEYETLFQDLNTEDAQAIQAELIKQKKDYVVRGNSILVKGSVDEIAKMQLEFAGTGIAGSGRVGLEIFDKNSFGMTDFTEQVNLQRALQGELSRVISHLSEVTQAHVFLVMPKESVFPENKEESKASVVLKLKKGADLQKSSIAGIKRIIAGAVPRLYAHNVSIVDEEGRLLSQSIESGDAARSEMESGMREQLEKEMSGKVISILEKVVGQGNVHANASIDLDFNTTEQTEETFNPNPPVVISQQKSEEKAGGGAIPSGVPGTQSNLTPPAATGSSIPERIRQSETTNYEVNKLIRHTVQPKGTVIRRLTLAVIVNNKTINSKSKNGKDATTSQPRTQQELDSYRDLVLAAVGYNEQRGDNVKIENVPFYSETKPEEPQTVVPIYVKYQHYLLPGMKYLAIIVLFLIGYIIFIRPIRKRVFQTMSLAGIGAEESADLQLPAETPSLALPSGKNPEELAAAENTGAAAALPAAEASMPDGILSLDATDEQIERELMKEANMVDLGSRKYTAMKKKLMEKARKDPEMVSQLLRSLLREKA